jgi:hypothetical protein
MTRQPISPWLVVRATLPERNAYASKGQLVRTWVGIISLTSDTVNTRGLGMRTFPSGIKGEIESCRKFLTTFILTSYRCSTLLGYFRTSSSRYLSAPP